MAATDGQSTLMRALLGLLLLLSCSTLLAQNATVYGTVRDDDGQVMPGVSVSVPGPKAITTNTDSLGRYELSVPPGDPPGAATTIRFSFLKEVAQREVRLAAGDRKEVSTVIRVKTFDPVLVQNDR